MKYEPVNNYIEPHRRNDIDSSKNNYNTNLNSLYNRPKNWREKPSNSEWRSR